MDGVVFLVVAAIAAILLLAVIGFVNVVIWLGKRGKAMTPTTPQPEPAWQPLTRGRKLAVVEEVLGERMPPELLAELRTLLPYQFPPMTTAPVVSPAVTIVRELLPHQFPPATTQAVPAEAVASVSTESREEANFDLGAFAAPAGLTAGDTTLDDSPLLAPAEVVAAASPSRSKLRHFLSFENIIFLLAACLILGGTLYLVATTWDRVSAHWQHLYAEGLLVFYGSILLVTARFLRRRLGLDAPATVLAGLAAAMSIGAVTLAAAAFRQDTAVGVLGTLLAEVLALPAAGFLIALHGGRRQSALFFGASILGLALAGACLANEAAVPGAWLAAAGVFAGCGPFLRAVPRARVPLFLTSLAPAAGAILLPATLDAPAMVVAPSLVALAFACRPSLRILPSVFSIPALCILVGLALGLGHDSLPMLVAIAAVGLIATLDLGSARPRGFLFLVGAALVVFLAFTWTAVFGFQVGPATVSDWEWSRKQASRFPIAALGALPWALAIFVLALSIASRSARANVRSVGYLILLGAFALAFSTFPSPTVLVACTAIAAAIMAYGNARAAGSEPLFLIAHLLGLATTFLLGQLGGNGVALAAAGAYGMVLLSLRGRVGFWLAVVLLPILALATMGWQETRWLAAALFGLYGLLLLRPRPATHKAIAPLILPALLAALLAGLFYAGSGQSPLLTDRYIPQVVLLALLPATLWTSSGRAPLFITVEILIGLAASAAGGSASWVLLASLVLLAGRDLRGLLASAVAFLPLAGLALAQSAPKAVLVAGLAAGGGLCLLRRLPDKAIFIRWLAMPGLLSALMAGGCYRSLEWSALSADRVVPLAALGLAPFFAVALIRHAPEFIAIESVVGAILIVIAGLSNALLSEPGTSSTLIAGAAALALLAPVHDKTFQARWLGLPGTLAAVAVLCLHCFANAPWMHSQFFPMFEATVLLPFFLAVVVHGGPLFLRKELLAITALLACLALATSLGADAGSTPALAASVAALAALWMFLGCARKHDPGLARAAWIVVPLVSPVAVVPMTDATMDWPAAVAGVAAVALLCYQSRRRKDSVMAAIALGAGLVALLWAGAATAKPFSHGGDPARHLALLAMVIAAYGMVMGSVGRRISAASVNFVRRLEMTTVFLGEAALLIGIGLRSQPGPGEALSVVLAFATLSCAAVLLALRSGQGWPFYVAETALGMAYAYLRVRTGWLDGVSDFDSLAGCVFAFVNLGIARTLRKWRAGLGAKESELLAFVFPLLAPLFLQIQSPVRAVGTFASAAAYAWFARRQNRPLFGWVAGLLANIGLIPLWIHYDVHTPIAFALPVGTTLALLGRVYDDRLGRHGPLVRSLASLFVFGATSYQMFQFSSPWPALILAVLAVLAVLLGVVWRVRAYLYAGFACLLLDILTNLTRWGMQDRLRGALFGLAAGTALLVFGILVARHRAQLLERYRRVQGWAW